MSTTSNTVLTMIKIIRERKEKQNKEPTHALLTKELMYELEGLNRQDIEDCVNSLVAQGKIKKGNTINDKYLLII